MSDPNPDDAAAETDPAPADAAAIVAPEDPASESDPVIYAVLNEQRWPLVAGQIVYAATSVITPLVTAGSLRLPDVGQVEAAAPFHYALPPAGGTPPTSDEEA